MAAPTLRLRVDGISNYILTVILLQPQQYGIVEGDLAMCMSLYHGFELIQQHGLRALYSYLESLLTGDKGYGRVKAELTKNGDMCQLMDMLRSKFDPIR